MFKRSQVLEVVEKGVRNKVGHFVPVGSRVFVIKSTDTEVTARSASFSREKGQPLAPRIIAPITAFATTKRGRPSKAK
jgi:hypothetical protein